MEKQHKQSLKLGLLVIGGLLFFVVSVYFLGKKQNLFRSVIQVTSEFNNVKGLQIGNKVQFTGIKVGVVSDISILNDTTVQVEMSIDKDVINFINTNSKVEIANEGLMGNKLLTIYPGNGNFPPISEGDKLSSKTSVTTDELFTQAKNIIDEGKSVLKNLKEISEKLNNGEGDLAQLLNKNTITSKLNKASHNLLVMSNEAKEITQKINNGEGDISRLLNENDFTERIDSILNTTNNISQTSQKAANNLLKASHQINYGNGIINKLLYDSLLSKKLDLAMIGVNRGIADAEDAAETIDNSWILNLFSGEKKNKDSTEIGK